MKNGGSKSDNSFDSTSGSKGTRKSVQLKRTSFVDKICEYLRDAIYRLDFKPGDQINESKLMKRLDVSRSPIREAFRVLEGEGLIERVTQRGVFVKGVTLREIDESYSVRATLEAMAAELAVPNLTEDELNRLEDLTDKMEDSGKNKDFKKWSRQNYEFHRTFIKASNNEELGRTLKSVKIHERWLWLTDIGLFSDEYYADALKDHKNILKGFRRKDSVLTADAVKKHIRKAGKKVCISFSKVSTSGGYRNAK
jgi:DNA-binding GntR family transcriptional regulator